MRLSNPQLLTPPSPHPPLASPHGAAPMPPPAGPSCKPACGTGQTCQQAGGKWQCKKAPVKKPRRSLADAYASARRALRA